MLDEARIEELRRRVESDPASLVFAQLAEEFRRAGALQEAVRVCREGLARHPGYISARVTLGRALFELGRDDEAQAELEAVLLTAPDNLVARRSIADIAQRRSDPNDEPAPAADPVLTELESWLSAILNDRASRATT